MLVHTKGRWAGVPFTLADWQRDDIIRPLFGTIDAKGLRRYRTAYVEVGRKNGKSELAAGIALYMLLLDGEAGGEVYGAASDRDQATIVFHVAADMVRRSPYLSRHCKIVDSQKRIIVPATGSVYRAIPADAAGAHGYNAHAIIIDELHAQPNRELVDVLTTSTAAREQPLVFAITTAGYDRQSICWEWHEYAERVIKRTVDDPTFFAYLRYLPEDADWTDESLWHLANPALDDFRSREELRTAVAQAKERPAMENTVRRLYFSQWTQSITRWFNLGAWDACGGLLHEHEWSGREAFGGLDLSSTSDLSAFVLVLPREDGGYDVLTKCWLPQGALEKRAPMRPQLEAWARGGFLDITPGDAIDYAYIKKCVLDACNMYKVAEIGFDPWSATQIAMQLNEESGNPDLMIPVRQGFRTLSAPSKLLETLVANRMLNHGGHPVMRWCADNCVAETDPTDAIKPSKKHSSEKIDCVVALVTALERASAYTAAPAVEFYSFES